MHAEEKKKDAEAKWRLVKVCLPAGQGAKHMHEQDPESPLMGPGTCCTSIPEG
jgi:hypothetical protein